MIARGNFPLLAIDFSLRIYRAMFYVPFWLRVLQRKRQTLLPDPSIQLRTKFPIAFESPDHLVPWGTMNDNSTNRKFVLFMDDLVRNAKARESVLPLPVGQGRGEGMDPGESREAVLPLPGGEGRGEGKQRARSVQRPPAGYYAFLDLGCSGGQLVKDFKDLGWIAVGLEGSDYSLKHRRANWPELAGKNLFTCDITKPFDLLNDQAPLQFDLITAWEVIEHIRTSDLDQLFRNITTYLRPGGYFIASTTSASDFHDGVDLHQSKFTNQQWRELLKTKAPELEHVDLHLKFYQFVRYTYDERSFLTCRKRA